MKTLRQAAIREIIGSENIGTQEMLRERLSRRGFSVTQATLSRDMREMGIIKSDEKYTAAADKYDNIPVLIEAAVTGIDHAMNMVVFRCQEGTASAACAALDKQAYSGVVGTLAGDDTIFILMRTEKDAAAFAEIMKTKLADKNRLNKKTKE